MLIDRRKFIKVSAWSVAGAYILPGLQGCHPKPLRFGWVTDVHYAEAAVKWGRYFTESIDKLSEAIALFNQANLDFIIETGDFKDQNEPPEKLKTKKYLRKVEAVFTQFKGNRYHVLGNHDVDSLSKSEFQALIENSLISQDNTYYYFDTGGFRCIVLDACFREDGVAYCNGNFKWYDTVIPEDELNWLSHVLKKSRQPVLVFVHQLLDGEGELYVKNAFQVRRVLETYGNVMAVFQGHKHEGDYNEINGIHYITQKALVDGSGAENNSYSIVTFNGNGDIVIEGYRRAKSDVLQPESVSAEM